MKFAAAIIFLATVQAIPVQRAEKNLCEYLLSEEVVQDLTRLTEQLSVQIRVNGYSWLAILRKLHGVVIARWTNEQKASVLLEALVQYGYDPEEVIPQITTALNIYDKTLDVLTKKHFPWDSLKAEAVFIQLWKIASGNKFRLSFAEDRQEMVKSVLSDFCR